MLQVETRRQCIHQRLLLQYMETLLLLHRSMNQAPLLHQCMFQPHRQLHLLAQFMDQVPLHLFMSQAQPLQCMSQVLLRLPRLQAQSMDQPQPHRYMYRRARLLQSTSQVHHPQPHLQVQCTDPARPARSTDQVRPLQSMCQVHPQLHRLQVLSTDQAQPLQSMYQAHRQQPHLQDQSMGLARPV